MLSPLPRYGTHICVPFGAIGDALAHLTANSLRFGFNMIKFGFSVHCGLIPFLHSQVFRLYDVCTLAWESMFSTAYFAISAAGFCTRFKKTVLSPNEASSAA